LPGAVAGQVLNDVGVLAAPVVAAAWIALGVFVGKDGACRLKYSLGDKILTGDHLQPFVLAESFLVKSSGNVGVGLGEGERHAVSHKRILRHLQGQLQAVEIDTP
jgi:hypothetical protein